MAEHNENKYAYLRGKPAEELNELLELAVSPEGADEDEAYVDALLAELAAREYTPEGRAAETDRAWRAFQSAYNTEEGQRQSLYPDEPPQEAKPGDVVPLTTSRRKRRLRRALILAAVIACLLALCVPTALGYQGFFDMLGQWTDEQFHFGEASSGAAVDENAKPIPPAEEKTYQSIEEALEDYQVTIPLMPRYIPDGFEIRDLQIDNDLAELSEMEFWAIYFNGDRPLTIAFSWSSAPQSRTYEKDDNPVELYEKGGITHYLFQNVGHNVATWYRDGYECVISGEIAADELKTMIDSIYES